MELPKFRGDFRSQNPQNSKSSSAGNSFDNDKNYVERDKRKREGEQQINSFSYMVRFMVRRLFINTMNNERCRPQPMRAALSLPIEHALENSTDISAEITFGKCAFTLIAFSLIFF